LHGQILSSVVLEKLRIETETKASDKISKKINKRLFLGIFKKYRF
jgi:hypothetical protein